MQIAGLALALILSHSQTPGHPQQVKAAEPRVPTGVDVQERAALADIAFMVSKARFDQAVSRLKLVMPHSAAQVYVDWTPVPRTFRPGYRKAVAAAIDAWNTSMYGSIQFRLAQKEEDADLLVLFERVVAIPQIGRVELPCMDQKLSLGEADPPSLRACEARIAVHLPNTGFPHPDYCIVHLVGRAIGCYLGLVPTDNEGDIMGPDTHSAAVAMKPTQGEIERAKKLQQVRLALKEFATKQVAASWPKPSIVFDKKEVNLGEVRRGMPARFVFHVRNAGQAPLEINAKPSCGCTIANFDKVIQPGSAGKIEAEMSTGGFRGAVLKHLAITSNDPENPLLNLDLKANVTSQVSIVPGETVPVLLKQNSSTELELAIQIEQKESVTFQSVTCSVPYASAAVNSGGEEFSAGRKYKLNIAIDPSAPAGRNIFTVMAVSDLKSEPVIKATIVCEKGIIAGPQSLYLGVISSETHLPVHQTVTLSKSDGPFHIVKIEQDDPGLKVSQETIKEGSVYRVNVDYSGGWAAGSTQRKLVIHTDDSAQSTIEIPVIANIASTSPDPKRATTN